MRHGAGAWAALHINDFGFAGITTITITGLSGHGLSPLGVESGNSRGVCNTHAPIVTLCPERLNPSAVPSCSFLRWIKKTGKVPEKTAPATNCHVLFSRAEA
jgi:hypothetical protein